MELADKEDLYKKLLIAGKFTEEESRFIMKDVIRGISYLHALDPPVIHRDVKPENILVVNGRYKIADFGWSK